MRRAVRWGMLTLVVAMAAPVTAHAGSDRAQSEAEARFREGLSRVKKHDFEAARLSFEQAYVVLHRPLILWNLALAEEKTGHALDALAHFREVVKEAEASGDRASAQEHVDSLMTETSHVEVKAPPGIGLTVDGGAVVATTPLAAPLDVTPGHHVIEAIIDAQTPGGRKAIEVNAPAGQLVRVSFVPADSPAPAPALLPAPVVAPVVAKVSTPAVAPAPQAPAADTGFESKPFWTPRVITTSALGGAAVVLVGLGVYFGVTAQSNASTAQFFQNTYRSTSTCTSPTGATASACADWNAAVSAQNRDTAVSNVLYAVGGVTAAAAIATFFLWPKQIHGTGAWVIPVGIGFGAGGRF